MSGNDLLTGNPDSDTTDQHVSILVVAVHKAQDEKEKSKDEEAFTVTISWKQMINPFLHSLGWHQANTSAICTKEKAYNWDGPYLNN